MELSPDVVFMPGWSFAESRAALAWCVGRGVPRVVLTDTWVRNPRDRGARQMAKGALIRRYDAAFAAGSPQVDYLTRLGFPRDRCFMGCDVVDNAFFRGPSARPLSSDGRLTLLSVMRLIPEKNATGVLSALSERRAQWRWVIAGYGPEAARLTAAIHAHDLDDSVTLLGPVPYESLPRVYREADVYLQPSVSDTWALSVNEAMASGLPVIVSRQCGCHRDLVDRGVNGVTFDPYAPADLGRALDEMWDQRSSFDKMGRASVQIIERWDLSRYTEGFWKAADAARHTRRTLPSRIMDHVVTAVV